MKKFSILLLVLSSFACASEKDGLAELKRLCEKDAGLKIYKTAEAEGYYDDSRKAGVLRLLIPSKFRFTEYCNFEPNITSLFPKPGCWRLTKVSREIGQCNERVDEILRSSGGNSYPEFRGKNCIEVEKIEKPTATYKYEIEREEWWVNEPEGTKMIRGSGKIVNNNTGDVLGVATNYVLFPKGYGSPRSKPSVHCGSYQITGSDKTVPFATGLIDEVMK